MVDLTTGQLPWVAGELSRPNDQLFYQIILGAIPMDHATDELIKAFGGDEERSRRERERAAIAAVLIDRKGVPLQENAVAISSFAWALPQALRCDLSALGQWNSIEPTLVENLDKLLRRVDDEGNPVRVDLAIIQKAFAWLVNMLKLPPELIEPPSFALRVYRYYKASNAPEGSLLNSFFLADLGRASKSLRSNGLGAALRQYLRVEVPPGAVNLLADKAALEASVAPRLWPVSRWPSLGGHPLVTLQQAAINVARSELADKEGIVSVNGPPGTGKTTLLRDIVAACIVDRAAAMTRFADPEAAFSPSGHRMRAGEAFFHLYKLDASLRGHEVLVASSNNKAVENVSKELPATKAIGRSTDELSYFKVVSDQLFATDEDTERPQTWGLIAAVLGNAKNRSAFQKTLWWHDEYALRLYLKAAKGDSVVREITDPRTEGVRRETPAIITQLPPPTAAQAKSNWKRAKYQFSRLKTEIERELQALEQVRQACLKLAQARAAIPDAHAACAKAVSERDEAQMVVARGRVTLSRSEEEFQAASVRVRGLYTRRPGWISRLFRTHRWRDWVAAIEPLEDAENRASLRLGEANAEFERHQDKLRSLNEVVVASSKNLAEIEQRIQELSEYVEARRNLLGDSIVDDAFFDRGHQAWNLAAPWLPDSLQKKREDLFVAAMAVHKAFIDSSAQKVLHNLSVLMNAMTSGSLDGPKRALLGDLLSTLFLVIPVVSTTFASVDRMLGDLPIASIGWLLIDEAGQALPQAAVGALMRAKRAIVVGDPLQIPPVVSLPQRLTCEVCKHFGIDVDIWSAPKASSQTVADTASRFKAAFRSEAGLRYVGVPLLVHRRCQEPMFGVSNRIAYDDQMVHAVAPRNPGRVGEILGNSRWVNIDGEAESKWCPAEGDAVMKLLRTLVASGVTNPDIYVVTPFRIVAQELRRRLQLDVQLLSGLRVDEEWVKERVGTVHTFQGKEAESVIIVLGAPKASQHGARRWAGETPNLLNVMVSRAKQNLYIIGSHGAWGGVGYFRELARAFPVAESI